MANGPRGQGGIVTLRPEKMKQAREALAVNAEQLGIPPKTLLRAARAMLEILSDNGFYTLTIAEIYFDIKEIEGIGITDYERVTDRPPPQVEVLVAREGRDEAIKDELSEARVLLARGKILVLKLSEIITTHSHGSGCVQKISNKWVDAVADALEAPND